MGSEVPAGYGTGWGGNPYTYDETNDGSLKAIDGSSLIANSGDQTLKGNSGPWMAGDQVLSIDSTKSNVEYICVEMADDHPVAIQRATLATKDAAIATKDATIAANTQAIKDGGNNNEKMPTWAIAIIVVIGAMFLLVVVILGVIVSREQQGKPVFKPMDKKSVGAA